MLEMQRNITFDALFRLPFWTMASDVLDRHDLGEEPLFEPGAKECETIIKTPSPCCQQVHDAATFYTFFFPPCAGGASEIHSAQHARHPFCLVIKGGAGNGSFLKKTYQGQSATQETITAVLQHQSMILCKRSMWAQWIRSVNDVPPSCFTSSRWP